MTTKEENMIFRKALEIFYKTGSEHEYEKFVFESCGKNMFIATDICKKIDFYLEFLDNDKE